MSARPAILFVCLGNICRSPLAEGVAVAERQRRGLDWHLDSCGTGGWHVGEPPDPRSVAVARQHGVDIAGQRARQLVNADFQRFDWIVAMDDSCLETARRRAPAESRARVMAFMELVPEAPEDEVPDPYYGGPEGFRRVWELLALGMPRLFDAVLAKNA